MNTTTHDTETVADTTDTQQDEVVIRIEHLKKTFGSKQVLKDVSLELHKGENLVILGRSGQGKSVTIKCIAGLLQQDAGSCKVFGKEVKDLDEVALKELRTQIGFLFQSGALYDSMTVGENLAFPLTRIRGEHDRKKVANKVKDMLEHVGLADAVNKMPGDLSGGMRKRIGLARTLIMEPRIMLYDEPTTGLDPITSREISKLIMDMQRKLKISSIIITHDMECARITSDRMLVLNDGTYIAEGTYDELENSDNELVRAFFK